MPSDPIGCPNYSPILGVKEKEIADVSAALEYPLDSFDTAYFLLISDQHTTELNFMKSI